MASGIVARAKVAAVTAAGADIFSVPRPEPPAELSDEEAHEWREIVNGMPAAHFAREAHPLLVGYCRKMVRLRELGLMIWKVKDTEPFDMRTYLNLCRLETETCKILAVLATKMRLSQQTYQDRDNFRPETAKRPWER